MNRFLHHQSRLLLVRLALTLGVFALAVGGANAQVVPKTKALPSKLVTKSDGNVLPSFPLGSAGILQREIVTLTNVERRRAGLRPLVVRRLLTSVAQGHALNMAAQDTMSHHLDGKNVGDRLSEAGYQYSAYGENIAMRTNFPSAENIVSGWMNSPGHRANILNRSFTEISIGVATSSKTGRVYCCQVFGTPK